MLSFPKTRARFSNRALTCALLGVVIVWLPNSYGALTVNSTRVIFDSDKRNVSVRVSNPSSKPFAVQTWVNTAADDQITPVPFITSPPCFA